MKIQFLIFHEKKRVRKSVQWFRYQSGFKKACQISKWLFLQKVCKQAFFIFSWDHIFAQRCHFSVLLKGQQCTPPPPSLLPSLPENQLQASWAELVLRQAGQERGGRESALLSLREWHRWAKIDAPVKILMEQSRFILTRRKYLLFTQRFGKSNFFFV